METFNKESNSDSAAIGVDPSFRYLSSNSHVFENSRNVEMTSYSLCALAELNGITKPAETPAR
jgi:hypothetical protein